jgi:hypothetical protein
VTRTRDPAPWLIVILALISLGSPLLLLHRYDLASQFEDDAFYYFQIAKNVAHGHGFTFDGLHATNGFHPLWLFALIPVFAAGSDLESAVRTAGLLEVALLGLAGAFVYRALWRQLGKHGAAVAAVALFGLPGTRHITRVGLESALTMMLLSWTWLIWLELDRTRLRSWLALGTLCGLLALSRLETLCAVPTLLWLERRHLAAHRASILGLAAPTAALLVADLMWNRVGFGLWLPISGVVKHYWALADGYALPWGLRIPRPLPEVLAIVAASLVALLVIERSHDQLAERARASGFAFLLVVACSVVIADTLTVGYIAPWYLGPVVVCTAVACGVVATLHRPAARVAIALAAALSVVRVPYTVAAVRSHRLQAHLRGEAADWLRAHTGPNARIGAWNGGMLGYYSDRHIIMLDGLANSADFYRQAFIRRDLLGYLDAEHIDVLVTAGRVLGPLLYVEHSRPVGEIGSMYEMTRPLSDRSDVGPHDAMMLWSRR